MAAEMTEPQNNRIIIYGPKEDGTYVVEFRTAAGETLAISAPRGETSVLKHFQAQMPYGLCRPTTHLKERFCRRASRVKAASREFADRPARHLQQLRDPDIGRRTAH
jgi:hypothetical protein